MKQETVKVRSCMFCHKYWRGQLRASGCSLSSDRIPENVREIPEWCPLPDWEEPEDKTAPTRQPKPLSCKSFGGKNGEQENALYSAITTAAHRFGCSGPYAEYDWLENAPRASLVCELRKALEIHGYKIIKE